MWLFCQYIYTRLRIEGSDTDTTRSADCGTTHVHASMQLLWCCSRRKQNQVSTCGSTAVTRCHPRVLRREQSISNIHLFVCLKYTGGVQQLPVALESLCTKNTESSNSPTTLLKKHRTFSGRCNTYSSIQGYIFKGVLQNTVKWTTVG
uniref:Uncharacterized protein n=1 Tax=Rhipicephalus microplus TaxID=6941 RepID=A0A6G5AII8_RHIMP